MDENMAFQDNLNFLPAVRPKRWLQWAVIAAAIVLLIATGAGYAHPGAVIKECPGTGGGGDLADLRGVLITVDQDFASIEVVLGGTPGTYDITAELRNGTFEGALVAATRVTALIGSGQRVHFDFPTVHVTGSNTYALRFLDIAGPDSLYMGTAGIGNYPCPDLIVTTLNSGPIEYRSSAAGLVVLGPEICPNGDCPGDLNGDRKVNLEDLAILSANWLTECPPTELPILLVESTGFKPEFALILADKLGIPENILMGDGSVRFTNPALFGQVPIKPLGKGPVREDGLPTEMQAIQLDLLPKEPFDSQKAQDMILGALNAAGFELSPAIQSTPQIDHTMFQAVDPRGNELAMSALDTQVNFDFAVGSIPLIGPGAKMKFAMAPNGEIAHITMALPAVQMGPTLPLIPLQQAQQKALNAYQAQGLANLPNAKLRSSLVYYAPESGLTGIQTIQPHYAIGGEIPGANGGPAIPLRVVLVPAIDVKAAPQLNPQVQLFTDVGGDTIYGGTQVTGGNPPYSYSWISSSTNLSENTESNVQYALGVRKGSNPPTQETLTVIVTDSSGISTKAEKIIPITPLLLAGVVTNGTVGPLAGGILDVGTEWVGNSMGLGGSSANAGGFIVHMLLGGYFPRFNWGDFNAWERDFKDPGFAGGDDTDWADNVDAVFYTGHANGDGFSFPGNVNDGFMHYDQARWGNNDLEWISIAACGPLQMTSGGREWYQRWGPAFQGLHLINGYQTITFDNTSEGSTFALKMLSGKTVRLAWMETGIEIQPATWEPGQRIYTAVMGVIGPNNVSNYDDHFWGRGSTGPDIPDSAVVGYWIVWSST